LTATATTHVDVDFDEQRLHDQGISTGGNPARMVVANVHAHVTSRICDE
jgi:predicted rRNA methylase YqxC with S4 and FtsJ domains